MSDKLNTGVILFLWAVVIFVSGVSGNFNIGDDFSYAKAVENLYLNGEIRFTDWTSMTLIFQVILGYIYSLLFGFSFETLRLVSLSSGIAASLGIYFTSRNYLDEKASFILTFLSVFNPDYLFSSFHFSTDINFFCFFIWAVHYSIKYLNSRSIIDLILFTILLFLSFFIREISGLYAASFLIYFVYKKDYQIKHFIPLVLLSISYLAYKYWLKNSHGTPALMDLGSKRFSDMLSDPLHMILVYGKSIVMILAYSGQILLPLSIQKIKDLKLIQLIIVITAAIILTSVILFTRIYNDAYSFMFSHLIHHFPIGDIYNWDQSSVYLTSKITSGIIFIISFLSIFISINDLKSSLSKIPLLNIYLTIYVLFIAGQFVYPRYLIPVLFIIVLLSLKDLKIKYFWPLFLIMGFNYYYGIATVHDRLEYHRSINKTTNELMHSGVRADQIDAGFEFGAYHFYKHDHQTTSTQNWYWVQNDDYLVRPGKIIGKETLDSNEYTRLFPPLFNEKIYVIDNRKNNGK